MSGVGSGYDLAATTFSPDGRLFQLEYAGKAVDSAGTVVGLRCKDGVVLGVEKVIRSKLLVKGSNRHVHSVDTGMGIAVAGVLPDGRYMVNRAISEAANYKSFYGQPMLGHVMCDRLSQFMHLFSLYGGVRPMGTTVFLAAYDRNGPQLYQIEPSGISQRYFGCASGKGRQQARTEIEKLDLKELTCAQAVKEIARIMYTIHDETKDKPFELEMSWVSDDTGRKHVRVPEEVVSAAVEEAKRAIEEADMSD
mmetsp:Transcript_1033/g.2705  ORF Transcript_1033/g.2705 Transcript_1033/m.2705 type:complete len:251 (-) Transcript_1033:748-1500(-)